MRYLILSDIHGGRVQLAEALAQGDKLGFDFLVLLGDLLNHGPRNQVPGDYAPPEVATQLNACREQIIAVRGNCDSEVDSMMFSFPCNAPYGYVLLPVKGGRWRRVFLTHGHLHRFSSAAEADALGLRPGEVVLSGHTHVPVLEITAGGLLHLNPGSTTLPKGGSAAGFALLTDEYAALYNLSGRELKRLMLPEFEECRDPGIC